MMCSSGKHWIMCPGGVVVCGGGGGVGGGGKHITNAWIGGQL